MWTHISSILLWVHLANLQPPVIWVPMEGYDPSLAPIDSQPSQIQSRGDFNLGPCLIVINRLCPDPDINFFLYSKSHPEVPEAVRIGSDPLVSNLSLTAFNPSLPTKIIVHGYNSGMNLPALVEIRRQYLLQDHNLNVFTVDWSPLANGPCYPAAVWNADHAGKCSAQLVERIRELGAEDIHVIGFSLGAHVCNFIANTLRPYKIPRITGLDPAGPAFITAGAEKKLDKTDAEFVDVLHTNVYMQGTFEESGHVDFFLNGGIIQPGCWAENRFFACNHHRAPIYFAESINTQRGFWGWPCPSYGDFWLERCPPKEPQIIMGEHIDKTAHGVYLAITESVAPFAVGKYTGPSIEIYIKAEIQRVIAAEKYKTEITSFIDEDDLIESLNQASERHRFTRTQNFF